MKYAITKILVGLFCIAGFAVKSQYAWTQKASCLGSARELSSTFTIGHYGYVGCGTNGHSVNYPDWWRFNERTNSWSSIASYPGSGQVGCTAFSIGAKGYVGLGLNVSTDYTDFWEYDTINNTWTQIASFPGTARYGAHAFVIGTNAYICCGSTGGPPYLTDCWKYNSLTNTWSSIAAIPDNGSSVAFSIGKYGYVGCGAISGNINTSMYKYDTTANTWTSISSIPASNAVGGQAFFVLGDTAYSVSGKDNSSHYLHESFSYNSNTNIWSSALNFAGTARWDGLGFAIGNKGYVVTGLDSVGGVYNDLWEYAQVPSGINEISLGNEGIVVYPNPAKDQLTVQLKGSEKATLVQLLSITGQEVCEQKGTSNSSQYLIDVQSLSNGVYFLKVKMLNGATSIRKVEIIK